MWTVWYQTVDIKRIKSPQNILCVTDLYSRERRNYMIIAIYCFLYQWLCFNASVQILTIALNWYSSSIPCKRDLCASLWGWLLSEEAFLILWCSDFYGWEIIAFRRLDTVPGDIQMKLLQSACRYLYLRLHFDRIAGCSGFGFGLMWMGCFLNVMKIRNWLFLWLFDGILWFRKVR